MLLVHEPSPLRRTLLGSGFKFQMLAQPVACARARHAGSGWTEQCTHGGAGGGGGRRQQARRRFRQRACQRRNIARTGAAAGGHAAREAAPGVGDSPAADRGTCGFAHARPGQSPQHTASPRAREPRRHACQEGASARLAFKPSQPAHGSGKQAAAGGRRGTWPRRLQRTNIDGGVATALHVAAGASRVGAWQRLDRVGCTHRPNTWCAFGD